MRIGLISDTHGKLRPEVFTAFDDVALILHAGDIGSLDIITELEAIGPVHAVHGNTDDFDVRARYGESVQVTVEGVRITVTHGHLLRSPTPKLLRAAFPESDVIMYGHTHKPLFDPGPIMVVNPGAAGPARFHLKPSVAIFETTTREVDFISL